MFRMPSDFASVFLALKPILARYADRMLVKADTAAEYTLHTKAPSPYPQHKGQPMFFGSVRLGKGYVSFHLMPLYMCQVLTDAVPARLKKRMQGKSCFNFKVNPEPELLAELTRLTEAGFQLWDKKDWISPATGRLQSADQ